MVLERRIKLYLLVTSLIFFHYLGQLGALRDRHLVAVLVALVFVDLIYLAVWQSLFPLTTDIKELPVSIKRIRELNRAIF